MDIGDVATLDSAYESCDRWMGCIVCPFLGADGKNNMVDLLQKGKRVSFYKLKSGDGEARYSRQTTMGVRLPKSLAHVLSGGKMCLLKLRSGHGMVGP